MFQEDYHRKEFSWFGFLAHSSFKCDAFSGGLDTGISGTQVRMNVILDPDYLPDYLSASYDYLWFFIPFNAASQGCQFLLLKVTALDLDHPPLWVYIYHGMSVSA